MLCIKWYKHLNFFWLEILLFPPKKTELALHLDKNEAGMVKAGDRASTIPIDPGSGGWLCNPKLCQKLLKRTDLDQDYPII